ncbi:glycosyltransferase family 2 protein [Flavobacteriaceae bacterium]|nr:glycosyltransferase family 2 protein [Flavobacteriaceae bacterium]
MYKIATVTTAYNQFQDFNNWKSHYKEYCDEISYHIIVDNNSSDEYKKLYKPEFKNSIILEFSEGKGVTGGYNEAIKYIQENLEIDFILFIMQDMNIPSKGVTILANCLNKDPEIGAIAPVNLYENKSNIIREHGGTINKNDFSVKKHYLNQELNSSVPEMLEVDFLCGGNYMFRGEVFNKIGLYDEKIFMYGDEVDILMRLANYGYKVFSTTKTVCYHEHIYEVINGKNVRFPSNNALFFTGRNYFYLINKYGNYKNLVFGIIKAIYKSIRFILVSLIKNGSLIKPYYLVKGYAKGFFYS